MLSDYTIGDDVAEATELLLRETNLDLDQLCALLLAAPRLQYLRRTGVPTGRITLSIERLDGGRAYVVTANGQELPAQPTPAAARALAGDALRRITASWRPGRPGAA